MPSNDLQEIDKKVIVVSTVPMPRGCIATSCAWAASGRSPDTAGETLVTMISHSPATCRDSRSIQTMKPGSA
jgi:hypothetical protein